MSQSISPKIQTISRAPRFELEASLIHLLNNLNPGDRLPPEPDLARQLGVSRAMLREVVTGLVERGMLIRRQGIGTFVANQTPFFDFGLEVLESLDSLAKRTGLETEVRDLEIQPVEVDGRETKIQFNEEKPVNALEVSRVIAINGKAVAYLIDLVPGCFLSQSEVKTSIHGSVYDLLAQKRDITLSYSRTDILAVKADEKLAKRLEIARGTALIQLTAQLFDMNEQVVDYSKSFFVPGQFKFHVMRRLTRPLEV
jgi:GntR family transcriptional regulator